MLEEYSTMSGEVTEKLRQAIRMLLQQTYLLEYKYDKRNMRLVRNTEYDFCSMQMTFLKEYFAVAGIRMEEDTELGVIYIQGASGIGEKLSKLTTIYILLLKLLYDEKMANISNSVNIVVTFGELSSKVGEFRLMKSLSSMTDIKRSLKQLKKYQLVELLDGMEEITENTRIIIYPTINLVLRQEDVSGLLQSFENEEDTESLFDMEEAENSQED